MDVCCFEEECFCAGGVLSLLAFGQDVQLSMVAVQASGLLVRLNEGVVRLRVFRDVTGVVVAVGEDCNLLCGSEINRVVLRGFPSSRFQPFLWFAELAFKVPAEAKCKRESLSNHSVGACVLVGCFELSFHVSPRRWFGSESFDSTPPTSTDISFLFRAKERCQASLRGLSVCPLPEKLLTTSPFLVRVVEQLQINCCALWSSAMADSASRTMPARLCSILIAELQHDGGHARPDDTQNSWERDDGCDLAGVARQDSI